MNKPRPEPSSPDHPPPEPSPEVAELLQELACVERELAAQGPYYVE